MGIQFSSDEFNKFVEVANAGKLSPFDIDEDDILPSPWAYPDEDITWIGTVRPGIAMFGEKYSADDALVGVSPYRIIFFKHNINPFPMKVKPACHSYWFKIDFEGNTWTRGKLRKKEYVSLEFGQPVLRKGLISQEITIMNMATRNTGKQDKVFGGLDTCLLDGIQWYDPQAKKRVGRHAAEFHAQIMEAYQKRIPVTATELVYLFEAPGELDKYLAQSEPVAGRIVQAPQPVALKPPPPKIEMQIETPVEPEKVVEVPPSLVDLVICPKCKHENRPGTKFCGNCGGNLEKLIQTEIKVEQPEKLMCNNCQNPLEANWNACPQCGEKLPLTCVECGQHLEPAWKLCPQCGTKPE